jgi:hypothetical protein
MKIIQALSDHFINWSDYHERKAKRISPSKTKDTSAKTAEPAIYSAWIFNRALQALWEAWLQMCSWTGPWAQVLFISEQAWATPPDGLCSPRYPGKSTRFLGKLSKDKDYSRRALRDQSRTFETQGEILARAPLSLRGHSYGRISGRRGRDIHSLRQHARSSDEIRFMPILGQGGSS